MTNDATRASEKALPEINRRRMLLGVAAMPVGGMVAAAPAMAETAIKKATSKVSPELETAFKAVTDARQELVAAKDARDWLVDEWRHLWPRAPRSMQWNSAYSGTVETDIVCRSYRRPDGHAVTIKDRKEVEESRARAERGGARLRANASTRMKERHEKWRRDRLAEVEEMEAYLDETERLREASGSRAVLARIKTAENELERSIATLMEVPAASLPDLHIKARAALIAVDASCLTPKRAREFPMLGASFSVILDLIALAEGGEA